MRILVVSDTGLGLGIAARCSKDGHDLLYRSPIGGSGLVKTKIEDTKWHPDLTIFDNNKYANQCDSVRAEGAKILGPSRWSALVEEDERYRTQFINSLGWQTTGVEQGTNLYISLWFNGSYPIAIYSSVVYRRFMSGGAGRDVSCAGILSNFNSITPKTKETFIDPLCKSLRKVNHRGPIHIHAFVDGDKFCVKELFTSFVHPFNLPLLENVNISTSDLLLRVLDETSKSVSTLAPWAMALQLSVPQNTTTIIKGVVPGNLKHLWFTGVNLDKDEYKVDSSGAIGYVSGRGINETECVRRVYRTVNNLSATDLQYRNDVGKHSSILVEKLRSSGWLW